MWRSTGRSGVGEQYLGEAYEDIDGLTPNGRQWINPLTKETRNLSGANYWHMRKSLSADEIVKPDVWTADGKANIAAFSDEALGLNQKKTSSKKSIPIAHQIVPQEKTLDRLDKQEAELYKAFENQEISEEEFKQLIYALEQKRHRAWKSRCKALGIAADAEKDEETGSEWQDKAEIVGKNGVEKRDWWEGGNVFILTHKKLKDLVKTAVNKKMPVDKEKLSPYIGGVVLSFITFVILF